MFASRHKFWELYSSKTNWFFFKHFMRLHAVRLFQLAKICSQKKSFILIFAQNIPSVANVKSLFFSLFHVRLQFTFVSTEKSFLDFTRTPSICWKKLITGRSFKLSAFSNWLLTNFIPDFFCTSEYNCYIPKVNWNLCSCWLGFLVESFSP